MGIGIKESKRGVMPVLLFLSSQSGIQHFTQFHQERCILHNTFMLTNLIKFLDPRLG
ncbi:hypothetical protein [Wolbachia endosymbiont of Dactylopius coccus]